VMTTPTVIRMARKMMREAGSGDPMRRGEYPGRPGWHRPTAARRGA
jgi:hypothetical protein